MRPRSSLRPLRAFLLTLAASLVVLGATAAPAFAHNSFESSDPSDGAQLAAAPPSIAFRFVAATPLDTVQVDLIDDTGARQQLTELRHGSSDREVIAAVPTAPTGALTARWRLVGEDGHVVSGRVGFTVSTAGPATAASPASPTTIPVLGAPDAAPVPDQAPGEVSGQAGDPFSTPGALRWLLRLGAFAALVLAAGVLLTVGHLWPAAAQLPLVGHLARGAIGALVLTTAGQLLVLASDISGEAPLEAWGGLRAAIGTDAGGALLVRLVVIGLVAAVLFVGRVPADQVRWMIAAGGLGLTLITWAYAGHARSMRWPWLGVPLDVVHYAAAAAWMGGLIMMVAVVCRRAEPEAMVVAVQRFAALAGIAVLVVVASGILQAVRLVGGPSGLLNTGHGRLLAFKLFPLGAMLYVADVNRRRVDRRFRSVTEAIQPARVALRRAMTTESALGAGILMVTAALVVTPPATSAKPSSGASVAAAPEAAGPAGFDRALQGPQGSIQLQVDTPTAGQRSAVRVVPLDGHPSSIVLEARPPVGTGATSEIVLQPAGSAFVGALELAAPGGWRLAVVLDGDRSQPFVATLPVSAD